MNKGLKHISSSTSFIEARTKRNTDLMNKGLKPARQNEKVYLCVLKETLT